MFLTWMLGQIGSAALAVWLLEINPASIPELSGEKLAIMAVIVAFGQLASTIVGLSMIWIRYRRWEIFGFRRDWIGQDVGLGLLALVMVLPGILVLQWSLTFLVKYEHGTLQMLMEDSSGLTIAGAWFGAVLVAPICEEIFFRGVLQSWLQRLGYRGNAPLEMTIAGGWAREASVADPVELDRTTEAVISFENEKTIENPYLSPATIPSSARREHHPECSIRFDGEVDADHRQCGSFWVGSFGSGRGTDSFVCFRIGIGLSLPPDWQHSAVHRVTHGTERIQHVLVYTADPVSRYGSFADGFELVQAVFVDVQ